MAVSCGECKESSLSVYSDPLLDFDSHAVIDFSSIGRPKEKKRIAKALVEIAFARSWLYQPAVE